MSIAQSFVSSLDTQLAKLQADQVERDLRVEYLGLLKAADPNSVARLIQVSDALGQSRETIKSNLALVQKQLNPTPAPVPPSPVDMSKMTSRELLALAMKKEEDAKPEPIVSSVDTSKMTTSQLMAEAFRTQGPARYPDGTVAA